ncbi:ATP-binding protein [Micromonospora sp. RTP1Z1]|uniref:AlbA family DNA-binding domain-containing protein n=1 Tax=Micromonospora sp. RTP1Z1 TaxID=2994043 RepID=UPI0029C739FF|nr:ATP-binding protein [Micromonospora sp. RTP1Z1]
MTTPRRSWTWRNWAQAEAEVASGEVHEHQQFELKRDNYGTSDSAKKELAKDVAALAIDGGTLVIGIEEDRNTGRAAGLAPVELAGQVERIQSVCFARIDPPLAITVTDVVNPSDPRTGLIVIDVPSSPFAPHQVDGRYLGRADRTVRPLSDSEVFRLHRLRDVSEDSILPDLERARRSAAALDMGASALTMAVAPLRAHRPELLRDELPSGNAWLASITDAAQDRLRAVNDGPLASLLMADPSFPFNTRSGVDTPSGFAFRYSTRDACDVYLEVAESGAITLSARNVTDWNADHREHPQYQKVILPNLAATYAALALATFSEIAERSGFGGIVGIALRLDGTLGVTPVRERRAGFWDPSVPYPDEHYQRVTSATTVELRGDLTPVMDRLCGRFFRALGLGDSLRQRPAGS